MAKDEGSYRWIRTMGAAAMQRYRARDIDGLRTILKKYVGMLGKTSDETKLSTLETATAQCLMMLAESHLDVLDFEECLGFCADVKEILEAKARRYEEQGVRPRPDSIAWCYLVDVLSDAKWKGPVQFENSVLDIDSMMLRYERAEVDVRTALAKCEHALATHNSQLEVLACCGLQVLRALMRFQPSAVARFKLRFASRHGPILDEPQYHYYWYIRICELFLCGCKDQQEYRTCYENCRRAYLALHDDSIALHAFNNSSAKELAYLVSMADQQRPIIDFDITRTRKDR